MDVLVTSAKEATLAAKRATTNISIVMINASAAKARRNSPEWVAYG
jgi:hypothetical protein